jgi:hypothetical protein
MNLGHISELIGGAMNTALLPWVGITLFLLSCIYAMLLNTETGMEWAQEQTWFTVVIGNGLVIGALALLLPAIYTAIIIGAFAVAGIPIIYRSLANQNKDRKEAKRMLLDDEA